ncbi:MAG: T9SS type A sorting domain-containing protein [Patescibacteria group bacterium]|nr:T9SS type A sorting domain-containing protein [Patescibacteria group bacterium]
MKKLTSFVLVAGIMAMTLALTTACVKYTPVDPEASRLEAANQMVGTVQAGVASAQTEIGWVQVFNTGSSGFSTQDFIKTGNGNIFAWDMVYGIFRSSDNGAMWTNARNGFTTISCFAADGENIFVGEDSWGKIFKSTDYGENWTAITDGSPVTLPAIGLVVSGTHMLVSSGNSSAPNGVGFYLSDDEGQTWNSPDSGNTIKTVKRFFQNNGKIYVGTAGDGIYVSADGGKKWKDISIKSDRLGINTVNCLAVQGNQLFAGTQAGLFVSTDDGVSWTAVPGISWDTSVRALAVSGKNIFLGTWGKGLFLSTDSGTTWSKNATTGLPTDEYGSAFIISLFVTDDGYLLAGAFHNGIWRRALSEMIETSVEEPDQPGQPEVSSPTAFQLAQNFPNPFNPTTTIVYSIPKSSSVRLSVFDASGREVAVLVNARQNAGEYRATFNGANLPAGVYFYRLQADNFIQTKKMSYLK